MVAKIGLVTLFLALLPLAQANTILTLDPVWSDYTLYSYTDIYGTPQNDIPIGPYFATLDGGGYSNTSVALFCYDFNSPTSIYTQYSGTIYLTTDFTGSTLTAAMEASYLIYELSLAGMANAPLATRGAISLAIWEIMNPSSTTSIAPFPTDVAAQPWEYDAAEVIADGTWTAADAAQFPVWVPDDPTIQRFGFLGVNFSPNPPNPPEVPEPGTLVLVGAGLIGLSLASRKLNGFLRFGRR